LTMFRQLGSLNYTRSVCAQRIPVVTTRFYAKKSADKKGVTINFEKPYKLHLLDNGPATSYTTTREELLDFFHQMTLIRRVEIASDVTYKQKLIRGFLHLYNGQEAVATGLESALTPKDQVNTAYRCHGSMLTKRCSSDPKTMLAELFGRKTGCSSGKGGSMHMYNLESGFYGGNGIVGAQVPLGTGIAFSQKYLGKKNVCLTAFGDGAANQGQVYESFNLAAIHKLPCIYLVENNQYGMGTSVERASATPYFYTRGLYIPGIQFDGMNVLQAREVGLFAVKHAHEHGPILLEAMTYRYKGHSMSDPGTTYRTRDEVDGIRKASDPIAQVHHWLVDNSLATEDELAEITAKIKAQVDEAVNFASSSPWPTKEDLYKDIYTEKIPIRGVELSNP